MGCEFSLFVVFFSGFLKSFSCIVFLSGVTLSFLLPSRFFFFFVCNHLKEKQQQQRLKERNKRETTQIERDCPRSSFLLKSLSQSYSSPPSTTPPPLHCSHYPPILFLFVYKQINLKT